MNFLDSSGRGAINLVVEVAPFGISDLKILE